MDRYQPVFRTSFALLAASAWMVAVAIPRTIQAAPPPPQPVEVTPKPAAVAQAPPADSGEEKDELDMILEEVESRREKEEKYSRKLKRTWGKLKRIAGDRREDMKTRVTVLKKFLERYPDENPYKEQAEALLRDLHPGTLVVRTEPEGAFVTIKGLKRGQAPLVRKAKAGTYIVKARKKGYLPAEQKVEVEPGVKAEIVLTLSRIPGTLVVTTKPAGATVFANDEQIGQSPLTTKVPSGDCRVKVALDGYVAQEKKVKVIPHRKVKSRFTMVRGLGVIKVVTEPAGAMVSIDGKEAGPSPVEMELATGDHPVIVMMEGYIAQEKVCKIEHQKTEVVTIKLPHSPPGTLVVTSEPTGAKVQINGKKAGTTPVEGKVNSGTYKVVVEFEGYQRQEKEVRVKTEQRTEVAIQLTRTPLGILAVETEPAGAKVLVNHKEAGSTPLAEDLPAGKHLVEVELDGYERVRQTVEIKSGTTTALSLTLKRIPRGRGTLVIKSKPEGAKVTIDDEPAGMTPVTKKMPPGGYIVMLAMPGYSKVKKLALIKDQETTEIDVTLAESR